MRTLPPSETVIRARAFLIETQRPDGSFAATRADGMRAPKRASTGAILAHALLLDTLNTTADESLDCVCDRLAQWLIQGLVATKTTDHCVRFQVLAAVGAYRREYLTDTIVASAVRLLTQAQTQPGGPYRNNAKPDEGVDLATNIAIARFLRLVARPLPKLDAYILQAADQSLISPYFVQDWPLRQYLHALFPAHFTKPAATRTARTPSSWRGEPVCKGPNEPETFAYGLAALDAARTLKPGRAQRPTPPPPHKISDTYPAIITTAKREAASLELPLKTIICAAIDRVRQSDTRHEIGPLAIRFAAALPPQTPDIPAAILRKLGVANLYAWIAYTIYDDFLDDEGKPNLLPAANAALRRSVAGFSQALPDHAAFQTLVARTFDTIDAANTWEVTRCRFALEDTRIAVTVLPKYGDMRRLYQRSLSHSLPVMGVMAAARISLGSRAAHAIHTAFKQYLIVRQLSDDLRDWKEDVQAGHISPVVAHILAGMQLEPGSYELIPLVTGMEQQFWQHSLLAICQEIQTRVADAQKMLAHVAPVLPQNVVGELLDAIDSIIGQTIAQRQQAGQFLAAYRQ